MNKGILITLFIAIICPCFGQDTTTFFRQGRLPNGLTYFVRHTGFQPGYADFYLVQNVGALMEDNHQNGLAHFLEHMAFNGTASFPQGIPGFLRRHGIKDFNAQTGQDETVYYINEVPVRTEGLTDSCLLVLKDWSCAILLDPEEIDKERGVIFEERRLRRTVDVRIKEQTDPYVLNGSKYATHNVIGSPDVLANFTPEELREYYHDFYRPDLQAVIVVGDIDALDVEKEIKRLFGPIPVRESTRLREVYEIPENADPLYVRVIDKDLPRSSVVLTKRTKKTVAGSVYDWMKERIICLLYNRMVNTCLKEYIDTQQPSFLAASLGYGPLVRNYDRWRMAVQAYPNRDSLALWQILEAIGRIHRYELNEKRLQEVKKQYLTEVDETAGAKEHLPNRVYVEIYQNHFLTGTPLITIDEDIALSREIVSRLTVQDLHRWLDAWNGNNQNWTFIVQGPDEHYAYPTREEIAETIQKVGKAELRPLNVDVKPQPLMDLEIGQGKIVREKQITCLEAEKWTLSNGCKVYYRFCDKDGPVVSLMGQSPGGMSLLPSGDLPSAHALNFLALKSGLYKHDNRMMETVLKGHNVHTKVSLEEKTETVSGYCNTEEAEILFQMIYLCFEKPRFDRFDFEKYVYMQQLLLGRTPKTVRDSISGILADLRYVDSPRRWKRDSIYYAAMSFDRMVAIYKDRFRDASDFCFYLTGKIDREEAYRLAEHYLGALPSIHRQEHPVEHELRKKGPEVQTIEASLPDQRYLVSIGYQNQLKLKPEEHLALEAIRSILADRYRSEIREAEGGAYDVNVKANHLIYPVPYQFLGIDFQTSLEKGDRMRAIVYEEIRKLVEKGVTEEEAEDAVLTLKKQHSDRMATRGNAYWMSAMRYYHLTGKEKEEGFEKAVHRLNGQVIQKLSAKFFYTAECSDIVIKSKE